MELLWVLVATGTLGANLPHVTFSDAVDCTLAAQTIHETAMQDAEQAYENRIEALTGNLSFAWHISFDKMEEIALRKADPIHEEIKIARNKRNGALEFCSKFNSKQTAETDTIEHWCNFVTSALENFENEVENAQKSLTYINSDKINFTCIAIPKK